MVWAPKGRLLSLFIETFIETSIQIARSQQVLCKTAAVSAGHLSAGSGRFWPPPLLPPPPPPLQCWAACCIEPMGSTTMGLNDLLVLESSVCMALSWRRRGDEEEQEQEQEQDEEQEEQEEDKLR